MSIVVIIHLKSQLHTELNLPGFGIEIRPDQVGLNGVKSAHTRNTPSAQCFRRCTGTASLAVDNLLVSAVENVEHLQEET